jgi:hypothetical protein
MGIIITIPNLNPFLNEIRSEKNVFFTKTRPRD